MSRFIEDGCCQYLNEGFDDLSLSRRFTTLNHHHHHQHQHHDYYQTKMLKNMMCIGDAQMKLLKCWRNFLELYVPLGTTLSARAQHLSVIPETTRAGGSTSTSSSLIGSFSPTVNHTPDSPGARGSDSLFDGDKRSYELITVILKQFGLIASTTTTATINNDYSLVFVDGTNANLNIPTSFIPNDFDVFSACVVAGTLIHYYTTTLSTISTNTNYREVPDTSQYAPPSIEKSII